RCIVLFQKINGMDVMLFGLVVYEYGEDCPEAIRGRSYISYLDSVQYLKPSRFRSAAYRGMLIGYTAHAKQSGFHTVHLWVCPPEPGDDFMFHAHPEDQRVPDLDRLLSW
ncbi:unnamed protein product, partial [Scytosiphon promiscuus]